MALRQCLDCGALSQGRRCPPCARTRERTTTSGKRQVRPYTAAERARRAQAVQQHVAAYGQWCPGWNREPHPSGDLTADHGQAVASGGDEGQELNVLCRACNSAKGARGG